MCDRFPTFIYPSCRVSKITRSYKYHRHGNSVSPVSTTINRRAHNNGLGFCKLRNSPSENNPGEIINVRPSTLLLICNNIFMYTCRRFRKLLVSSSAVKYFQREILISNFNQIKTLFFL